MLGQAAVGLAAIATLMAAASRPAPAFTGADADTAVNSYLSAFVTPNGGGSFIKGDQNGGDPGFWQEVEEIEGIEDANDRKGGALNAQVSALLNGFSSAHGTNWSGNMYNDDISWAVIAYTRGYQETGNTTFRTIAKNNFDLMWARAWNSSQGALYWTTDNNSYNSCIECPAGIAAYLLSQALGDSSYQSKAQSLLTWEKGHLFNGSSGAVWDSVNTSGSIGYWSSTYNQGTFVGLANYLGDTASAKTAASYTMYYLGDYTTTGYKIMPQYGSGGQNNSGLNSISLRWIAKFMKDRGLQSTYLGWLQANANAAWNVRRTSDNLSWCQWLQQTPSGVLDSWDCINSVAALQVVPAGNTPQRPYFMVVNQNSGKCLDLSGGNTANGAVTNQWSYDYNGANERWALIPTETGDHFLLISWVDGKAVSVSGDSIANEAQLVAWDYNSDSSQQWDLVDAGSGWCNIRNVRSGLYMDVSGASTADSAKIQQYANTNSAAQRWRLQPWGTYSIRAAGGRYICVQGAGSTNNSPIIQYDWQNNPWFNWAFTNEGDGYYALFSLNAPTRVISVVNTSYSAGANTQLYDYNVSNTGDQKVRILPKTDGNFKFYFKHDDMSWDIPGGNTANNVNLQQYPETANSWQEFGLERN